MSVQGAYLAVYPDDEDMDVIATRYARQRATWESALETLAATEGMSAMCLAMLLLCVEFCGLRDHIIAISGAVMSAETNASPHLAAAMHGFAARQKAVAEQLDTWAAEVAAMKH